MPIEPLEFYGVFLASRLARTHNNNLVMRLGEPDAIMRRGVKDNLLYKAERVFSYASTGKLWPAPANPPSFYLLSEASRMVGITERALKSILGDHEPPAILIPEGSKPFNLWPEQLLRVIRKLIAEGQIKVRPSSLSRPKLGARIIPARHRGVGDIGQEAERWRKAVKAANPFSDILW